MNSPRVTLEKPLAKPPLASLIYRHAELRLRKATSGLRALPDFIIAGAQKCGTSSLHQYLVQHPRLSPATVKEVHFFDGGLDPAWDKYADGEALYRSYFPFRSRVNRWNALCFEASPDYIFNPLAAERMFKLVPTVKLVLLLRDPVERAISHYFHELRRGRETMDMASAFALEEERLAPALQNRNYKDTRFINLSYKARGRYAEQLARLFQYFPRKNIKVLEAERLFEDPLAVTSEVLEFLGVDGFPQAIDASPTGSGGNKSKVDGSIRSDLQSYFSDPNKALVELLGQHFRWA